MANLKHAIMQRFKVVSQEMGYAEKSDLEVLPLLQQALMGEYQQWDLYYSYKALLLGQARESIADHFTEHADDEAGHIDLLQRYIVTLGHQPTVTRKEIPELTKPSVEDIIALELRHEIEAVQTYKKILTILEKNGSASALKVDLETVLSKEREHVQDLQLLLGAV